MTEINTHNLKVDFGKYKDTPWTRVPVSYLRWVTNELGGLRKEIAESELKRRGTTTPMDLELSGHAIDRASQITDEWKEQGVHSWLQKIANDALMQASGAEEIVYKDFKFAFVYGNYYPVLKTIIRK